MTYNTLDFPTVPAFAKRNQLASCAATSRQIANQQNRRLRLHFGAPVAMRSNSTWAGTWSGVTTISDYPSSEVQLPYHGERECGRVLVTRHAIGPMLLYMDTLPDQHGPMRRS